MVRLRRQSKTTLQDCQQSTTWSYWSADNGPYQWNKMFSQARGMKQSPVAICEKKSVYDPLLSHESFHLDYHLDPCSILNDGTGWTIRYTESATSTATIISPHGVYKLYEIRCHWGENGKRGSEHKIGDYEDVGEIQIVHYNTKYSSYNEAIQYRDGLANFAILLYLHDLEDNPIFDPITELTNKIQFKNCSVPIPNGFDAAHFIPERHDFWTYEGSLTAPPCNECVVWFVFRDSLLISSKQLDAFRSLFAVQYDMVNRSDHGQNISCNIRPLQPLNHRMVRCSFRSGAFCNFSWDY